MKPGLPGFEPGNDGVRVRHNIAFKHAKKDDFKGNAKMEYTKNTLFDFSYMVSMFYVALERI